MQDTFRPCRIGHWLLKGAGHVLLLFDLSLVCYMCTELSNTHAYSTIGPAMTPSILWHVICKCSPHFLIFILFLSLDRRSLPTTSGSIGSALPPPPPSLQRPPPPQYYQSRDLSFWLSHSSSPVSLSLSLARIAYYTAFQLAGSVYIKRAPFSLCLSSPLSLSLSIRRTR